MFVPLNKAIELLERYQQDDVSEEFFDELSQDNGATRLACYLMENSTTVNLFIGKAINKDYTTKELPFQISVRQRCDETATGGTGGDAQIGTCVLLLKKRKQGVLYLFSSR